MNMKRKGEKTMDDLISRQAVMVALKDALMAWSYMPEWRDEKILEAIAELPPAEPQIIRCKDRKHYEYGICKKAGLCVNKSPNGFCDWGER